MRMSHVHAHVHVMHMHMHMHMCMCMCMCRRLTGLAGGYVLVELGLHLSFEFTGRYGGVWWPFILAHQARVLYMLCCRPCFAFCRA